MAMKARRVSCHTVSADEFVAVVQFISCSSVLTCAALRKTHSVMASRELSNTREPVGRCVGPRRSSPVLTSKVTTKYESTIIRLTLEHAVP